ncbi:phage major capsid protein, HK97 family [Singulisphaera sp. GP187]|uniref:phage major capsid protein n=1 Tax=Singulisphaera sp. GP187 TaxID=1882752 RepID=UPI000926DDDB|nr:phage major capsid protein [Singulisphaera sp. GP187]SIO60160.1 phage major capsid protein, HK97 family [Singulisphaera sp. GP187]
MKEKAYELRQTRATKLDAAKEIVERAEKENRGLNPEEQSSFDGLHSQAMELGKRIGTIERQAAMEVIGYDDPEKRRSAPLPHEDPANTRNGKHRYSLIKAIQEVADAKRAGGAKRGAPGLTGLELEVSEEIAKRGDKGPTNDFYYPMGNSRPGGRDQFGRRSSERRALDTSAGAGAVPTFLDTEYIEILRNKMVLMALGAREIKNLQGKFSIPRQNGKATGQWVGEGGAPTGSNQTLDQVNFTPHTYGAFTDISRRFFELANIDGEAFVMDDIAAIIARAIDLAGFNGTGSSNQPLGIMQNSGITGTNVIALGANGDVPTNAAMVALETVVARGNADLGNMAYVTNADGRGTLKTTAKIGSTFPIYIWGDNNEINGYPAYATQQLPRNLTKGSGTNLSPLLFGNWNDLIIAYWSGLDILVDPYTGSSTGSVRIVGLQDVDVQVRHNESFSLVTDMVTNQG